MKKYKKILSCILVNVFFLFLIIVFFEIFTYGIDYFRFNLQHYRFGNKYNLQPYNTKIRDFRDSYFQNHRNPNYIRYPSGLNYKSSQPIILFGCSFTYGTNLAQEETFASKLSKYTRRPVYNRASGGWSLQQMVFQLKNDPDLDVIKNPKVIIYTIIPDHINRLYSRSYFNYQDSFNLIYENKDNKLIEKKPKIKALYNLYSYRFITRCFSVWKNTNKYNENFDFMKLHFKVAKMIAADKYPNAKFVILKYEYGPKSWYINTPRWKELEQDGFIIFDANELSQVDLGNEEYRLFDGHPSGNAWDKIVPPLAKKLGI